jgi:hypothetical protein
MAGPFNEVAYRFYENGTGEGTTAGVTLLSNASATGDPTEPLTGGTYLWQYQGTFGGATLTLQSLGPDGSTYQTVTSATAAGQSTILVGQGDILRVTVTGGTPSALYSAVRRVS